MMKMKVKLYDGSESDQKVVCEMNLGMKYKIPGSILVKVIREMKVKVKVYNESESEDKNLGMEHKIPGSSESFLALAASKAHSLST